MNRDISVSCVCDKYDPSGAVPYDSVNDFLTMCAEQHGEEPDLTWQEAHTSARGTVKHDAGWYEGDVLVLVEVGS